MNNKVCEEIISKLRKYHLPRSGGVLKFSYIWDLWKDQISKKELLNCLLNDGAHIRDEGDEIYVEYVSYGDDLFEYLKSSYSKKDLEKKEILKKIENLQEINDSIEDIKNIWFQNWKFVYETNLGEKVNSSLIHSFISRRIRLEEKEIDKQIKKLNVKIDEIDKEIYLLRESMKKLGEKYKRK